MKIERLSAASGVILVLLSPVAEAEQDVAGLKRRGVPVEYILFPDEGHGFRKPKNRVRAAVASVQWFEEHLKER